MGWGVLAAALAVAAVIVMALRRKMVDVLRRSVATSDTREGLASKLAWSGVTSNLRGVDMAVRRYLLARWDLVARETISPQRSNDNNVMLGWLPTRQTVAKKEGGVVSVMGEYNHRAVPYPQGTES
jgi:hypothetical protein